MTKMATMEVSETLERIDDIVNMLDEICDHMDGFSSTEEAWLSSITETCALGAMSCGKATKARKRIRTICSFVGCSKGSTFSAADCSSAWQRHRVSAPPSIQHEARWRLKRPYRVPPVWRPPVHSPARLPRRAQAQAVIQLTEH
jgi:hypothetical protein